MNETIKKIFMVGLGASESLYNKIKDKADHYAQVGEESQNPQATKAKDFYKRMEHNVEELKDLTNPFKKKKDHKDKRIDELSEEINEVKKELAKLKKEREIVS